MRFLSSEWVSALDEALRSVATGAAVMNELRIGQIVTDTPEGTVSYVITIGGNGPHAELGSTDEADVVLVEDYESARAIALGEPAAALLSAGRVKVRGNAKALLVAQEHLVALAACLTALKDETVF